MTAHRLGAAFAPSPATRGAALAAGTVVAFAAAQGGFFPSAWRVGAVVLGALACLLVLWAPVRWSRAATACFVALAGLATLSLASAAWSADPSASVVDTQRTLLYLAGLSCFALAREGLTFGVALGASAVGAWSLAARVLGGTHVDPYEGALLTGPIGYANGLGALAAIGIAVCAALAIRERSARYTAPLGVLVPVLALTNSRAGLVVAVVGCVVAAVVQWRRAFAAVVVLGATAGLAVLLVLTPGFLGDRASYWRAAGATAAAHPLDGSGAGTFGVVHQQAPYAHDAHSLYLQVFSELGVGGLLLVVAFLAVPLVVAVHRGLAAPAAGLTVFVLHAGVDWDWQLPAVTLAALALVAAATRKRSVKSDYPLV